MPRGAKPDPPGTSNRQRAQWKHPQAPGWQHGRRPNPPSGLSDAGKKAWQTWLGSWWAYFYTPDDLPGLELTVKVYDGCLLGHVDVAKVTPLLDRYGITPKGRQDLRWAEPSREEPAATSGSEKVADELSQARQSRQKRVGA